MFDDTILVISWWVVWFFLGVSSFPVAWLWLSPLFDKGYSLAKIFGLVVVGYLVWLVVSLKIVSFERGLIWIIWILWAGLNVGVARKMWSDLRETVEKNWRLWLRLELLFLGATILWSLVRGFQPDINGLEKFMDFGFVQSILQSRSFPPHDMWFAGGSINYYYFGHYLSAVMTWVSGIKPAVAYNLMIGTLFGLTVSAAIAVGGTVVGGIKGLEKIEHNRLRLRWLIGGGLLTSFLMAIRGNLHTVTYFINNFFNEAWGLNFGWLPSIQKPYWYPDATRYIPFTIHEFPMYSFVVADLHAHLLNLPIVLLLLGGVVSGVSRVLKTDKGFFRWWEIGILGWLLGVFAMTNAWDVPIYGLLIGITLLILGLRQIDWINKNKGKKLVKQIADLVQRLGWSGFSLIGLALLVSLPFQLNFEQIAQGVLPVNAHSEVSKLLVLWGWDMFLFVSLVVFIGLHFFYKGNVFERVKKVLGFGHDELSWWDVVFLGWYLVGWFLIVLPELVYVKDIYIADYHRANTMFKLVYQAWVIFAICGSYTIVRIVFWGIRVRDQGKKAIFYGWIIFVVLGLIAVGSYPRFALRGYYGKMDTYRGLDGETWLKNKYPDDYAGIVWLRSLSMNNDENQNLRDWPPVVLEAVGDSYTEFDRVSAYTGLPTVEGWLVHEWLWRGSYDQPGARNTDVEKIYTSADEDEVKKLLVKYGVDFVFVGDKEREKYPALNEGNLEKLAHVVFESGKTRIYQIDAKFKYKN